MVFFQFAFLALNFSFLVMHDLNSLVASETIAYRTRYIVKCGYDYPVDGVIAN